MTDEPLFRVTLPDGRQTKPYTRRVIREALTEGKIPTTAVVALNDLNIPIEEFCGATGPDLSLSKEVVKLPPQVENPSPSMASRIISWTLVAIAGAAVGFVLGMQYQQWAALSVSDEDLPGLYLDRVIYSRAVEEAERQGLDQEAGHFRSTLEVIESRLPQATE